MANTQAIYSGSFDPVTQGHLDIIRRAARLFGAVRVVVLANPQKKTLFTAAERVALLHQVTADIPGVTVDSFDGLLVDYMRKHQLTVLVRGVRNAADLESEQAYAYANKLLLPALQSVLLPADPALRFVSSSAVRDAWAFGLELPGVVPPPVAQALRAKLNASK